MSNYRSKRLRERPDPGRLRLWPIGCALITCFAAAVIGLASLTWVSVALLHYPTLPHSRTVSLHDLVGVLQLVFASVAGTGALVALVMAYRRQRVAEASSAHDRTRVFNERFTTIASQLGDDQPAVKLAGVHAMAGLADDWWENRQACIDVLCAYLRMPYVPDPGDDALTEDRLRFRSIREVRHTVIRVITAHLREGAEVSWQGRDFDLTGVVFDGGDFSAARFSGGNVSFQGAEFSDVGFMGAKFSAEFADGVYSGVVSFVGARFLDGLTTFNGAEFSSLVVFGSAEFAGGYIAFKDVKFSGGEVNFNGAVFAGGEVDFSGAEFSGGEVDFTDTLFAGSAVDFSRVSDWSRPPKFRSEKPPPPNVKLPPESKIPPASDPRSVEAERGAES